MEAVQVLGAAGSLVEAARYFVRHHPVALPAKSVGDVYDEFYAAKASDNLSKRYLEDIKSRLRRLKETFSTTRISELSSEQLEAWLTSLKCGAVARNSTRALVLTFFNFARQKGYLSRTQPTAADSMPVAKEAPTKIGIFQPEGMAKLLHALVGTSQLYLALGAFTGLRHAELMRLEWRDIKIDQQHVEVTAGKAKTAQRRLVPVQSNLRAWLLPHVKDEGVLFVGDPSRFLNRVTSFARKQEIKWPPNGLRHSYASYRLAVCKSAAEVALEMGNSPQIIFQHYRELVTVFDAAKWWSIHPGSL